MRESCKNIFLGIVLICLFTGFLLLLRRVRWLQVLNKLMKQTLATMDEAARQRLLQSRRTLLDMQKENTLWFRMEQELHYSGLKRRFPAVTAEIWIVGNLIIAAIVLIMLLPIVPKVWMALLGPAVLWGIESAVLAGCKMKAMRSVDRNLLKFLDFLGNYSITAGEINGIFNQVSKYVDEPLKSALDECAYEAQITGDTGLALLSMAEKIEHPKFRELVRNMEISIRYCADFSVLVSNSKRSVREYLRMGGERKGMLREAAVNLVLLIGLSGFIFLTVDGLIELSIWQILFFSIPGRIALGVLLLIFMLFLRQIYRMNE